MDTVRVGSLIHIWRYLTRPHSMCFRDWYLRLGNEFGAFGAYLMPKAIDTTTSCPYGDRECYRVVESHGEESAILKCGLLNKPVDSCRHSDRVNYKMEIPISLLKMYRLDEVQLLHDLAEMLEVLVEEEESKTDGEEADQTSSNKVGIYPYAGFTSIGDHVRWFGNLKVSPTESLDIFIVCSIASEHILESVLKIPAHARGKYILLVPSELYVADNIYTELKKQQGLVVGMDDLLLFRPQGDIPNDPEVIPELERLAGIGVAQELIDAVEEKLDALEIGKYEQEQEQEEEVHEQEEDVHTVEENEKSETDKETEGFQERENQEDPRLHIFEFKRPIDRYHIRINGKGKLFGNEVTKGMMAIEIILKTPGKEWDPVVLFELLEPCLAVMTNRTDPTETITEQGSVHMHLGQIVKPILSFPNDGKIKKENLETIQTPIRKINEEIKELEYDKKRMPGSHEEIDEKIFEKKQERERLWEIRNTIIYEANNNRNAVVKRLNGLVTREIKRIVIDEMGKTVADVLRKERLIIDKITGELKEKGSPDFIEFADISKEKTPLAHFFHEKIIKASESTYKKDDGTWTKPKKPFYVYRGDYDFGSLPFRLE